MSQTRFACLLTLLLAPALGYSASPESSSRALSFGNSPTTSLPIYASAFLDWQSIRISNSRFSLPVATVAAGWWGWPGIGLELELGRSLVDDSLNSLDLDVRSTASLSVRFESPFIDRVAAYGLFGVSRTNFDSQFSGEIDNAKQNPLRGARGVLGLTFKLSEQTVVDTAFSHHEYSDEISINSFRVGFRYDFSKRGKE